MNKITLNTLLNFAFENDEERDAFNKYSSVLTYYDNETKQKYLNGCYYLGGQIKLHPDDELSLKIIENVQNITLQRLIDYGGPCNSWEAASIRGSGEQLCQMENLIKTVLRIFSKRERKMSLDNSHKGQFNPTSLR